MPEKELNQPLSKKEKYEIRLQQKLDWKTQSTITGNNKKLIKKIIAWVLFVGLAGLLLWFAGQKKPVAESDVISRKGIHWHPILNIYIKGRPQTIPAEVGLGVVEQPIHTHETDNKIHLELSGLVTLDNTRLEKFFKIWGKQFNSTCIFDNCNGPSGTVKMFVNGLPNYDFEKYLMGDGDQIEIRYE